MAPRDEDEHDHELLRNVCGVLGERDLERVLGLAMEAIVALSGAERAMLVRRGDGGSLTIALARGSPDVRLSESVIGYAGCAAAVDWAPWREARF